MSTSSDKGKKTGIAAVFWIVLALVLLIVFLVKQDTIVRVLKDTNFFVHVFGEQPAFIENYDLPEEPPVENNTVVLDEKITISKEPTVETIQLSDQGSNSVTEEETTIIEDTVKTDVAIEKEPVIEEPKKVEPAPTVAQSVTSKQYLYFIYVNGDGTVERKETVRSVPKSTTPLTASLEALFAGPIADDKSKGYESFIPAGTKLLSVSIQDGTALINVSEEFSFNKYGVDGYLAQLMQVVYTATAFNTIKNVRFFIEGEQSSYLGNDGVWIGSPLARTDFK